MSQRNHVMLKIKPVRTLLGLILAHCLVLSQSTAVSMSPECFERSRLELFKTGRAQTHLCSDHTLSALVMPSTGHQNMN